MKEYRILEKKYKYRSEFQIQLEDTGDLGDIYTKEPNDDQTS